jgi:hypothetical protein
MTTPIRIPSLTMALLATGILVAGSASVQASPLAPYAHLTIHHFGSTGITKVLVAPSDPAQTHWRCQDDNAGFGGNIVAGTSVFEVNHVISVTCFPTLDISPECNEVDTGGYDQTPGVGQTNDYLTITSRCVWLAASATVHVATEQCCNPLYFSRSTGSSYLFDGWNCRIDTSKASSADDWWFFCDVNLAST